MKVLDCDLGLEGLGSELIHEKWTDPWKVEEIESEGSSAVFEMNGGFKR